MQIGFDMEISLSVRCSYWTRTGLLAWMPPLQPPGSDCPCGLQWSRNRALTLSLEDAVGQRKRPLIRRSPPVWPPPPELPPELPPPPLLPPPPPLGAMISRTSKHAPPTTLAGALPAQWRPVWHSIRGSLITHESMFGVG